MAKTNAERQKEFRQRQKALKPKQTKPKPAPMTAAERGRNYRERQFDIKCEQLAKEREVKRKEIIQYVKTMPAYLIDELYEKTAGEIKYNETLEKINNEIGDLDLAALIDQYSKELDEVIAQI